MGAVVVAAIAARQQRILRIFRESRALDPASARTLDELGLTDDRMLRMMIRDGYIIRAGSGYYLDEQRAETFRRRRKTIALAVVAVLLIAVLALTLSKSAR